MRFTHGHGFLAHRPCACSARSRSRAVLRRGALARLHAVGRVAPGRAALEAVAGRRLFDRGRDGVTLTPAGARLLPRAVRVLDELDAAVRETAGAELATGPVRLGAFSTAAAGLVPRALASLPRELRVTLREATTPALTRSLRAGTLDLAILALSPPFRPPDAESPALERRRCRSASSSSAFRRATRSRALARSRPSSSRARCGWRAGPTPATRCSASGRAGGAARRSLRRARLARQAADRRGRAGHHDARPGRARRAAATASRWSRCAASPRRLRRVVVARRPGALDGPAARVADALIAASERSWPESTTRLAPIGADAEAHGV